MFIDFWVLQVSSLQRSETSRFGTQPPVHCAPLERQKLLATKSINIWLLWSQKTVCLSPLLLPHINIRGLYIERNELPID